MHTENWMAHWKISSKVSVLTYFHISCIWEYVSYNTTLYQYVPSCGMTMLSWYSTSWFLVCWMSSVCPSRSTLHMSPPFSSRKLACKNCINKLFANGISRGLYENEIGELVYPLTLPASSQWTVHLSVPKVIVPVTNPLHNSPRLPSFLCTFRYKLWS